MRDSIRQCRHLVVQAETLLATLDDSHRAVEPAPGLKTAGWLVGHLAVTADYGRRLCGRRPICPVEWRDLFKPGTKPSTNAADYPPMAALREACLAVYHDLPDAAESAEASALAVPNAVAGARESFPTAVDFVGYLLAGHFAYHLGQLQALGAARAALSRTGSA